MSKTYLSIQIGFSSRLLRLYKWHPTAQSKKDMVVILDPKLFFILPTCNTSPARHHATPSTPRHLHQHKMNSKPNIHCASLQSKYTSDYICLQPLFTFQWLLLDEKLKQNCNIGQQDPAASDPQQSLQSHLTLLWSRL